MTPTLLRKLKELVAKGATVVGGPPLKSPSLSDFPRCDQEVKALAKELWGSGAPPAELTVRPYGKGRIFWGGPFRAPQLAQPLADRSLGTAKWIWRNEGNPAASAPPGRRCFRRVVTLDPGAVLVSARLLITADNEFTCYANGRVAGSGNDWAKLYDLDLKPLLKPGDNLLCVAAVNSTDAPNPAGLIGLLKLKYANGRTVELRTDARWEAAETAPENWLASSNAGGNWSPALELGPAGMAPWGNQSGSPQHFDPIPDIRLLTEIMERLGVPPDFSARTHQAAQGLRYIHRTLDGAEVYFVANPNLQDVDALCSFRVAGKRPELWWPDSGRTERAVVYDVSRSVTRLPIHLEPYGSVFVVLRASGKPEAERIVAVTRNGELLLTTDEEKVATRQPESPFHLSRNAAGEIEATVSADGSYGLTTAAGRHEQFEAAALPAPVEIAGPWTLRFEPKLGAPDQITLDKLISWSEHTDPGVKYFSGHATYTRTVNIPPAMLGQNRRLYLDLGKVAVMAEVKLNGQDLGILWKAPFRVDVTAAAKPGDNALEIRVVNLWINRQIGDEQLPEDSDRNPNGTLKAWPAWLEEGKPSPTGRFTFTSWRLWKKNDPLVESGLLGPVMLQPAEVITVRSTARR